MIYHNCIIRNILIVNLFSHRSSTTSTAPIEKWRDVLTEIHNSHIVVGHIPRNNSLNVKIEGMEFDLLNFHNFTKLPLVDSPFGRGTQTLVNKTVRNSKEYPLRSDVDKRIHILGQTVVNDVLSKFYSSIPYKVIVYENGSFFSGHVDTPEEDLMYTLVLILPSKYQGGDLVFGERYNTTEKMLETDKYINFVLFRINCPHRVERVTDGYRASVTYKVYKTAKSSTRFKGEKPVLFDIKLPKLDESNILIAYPNPDEIVGLLEKSDIDFMFAYGKVQDNITTVYSRVQDSDETCVPPPSEEEDDFKYIAAGKPYNISKIINVGFQKSFVELQGHTGNEGYAERFRIHYIRCSTGSMTPMEKWKTTLTEIHNSHIVVGHIPKTDTLKVNIEGMEFDLLNFHNFQKLPLVDSPFGRGTETLVDKSVRDSREYTFRNDIDKRIGILGQSVVNDVLGNYYYSIPYKVIVYEKGSFFSGHVDTPEDDLVYTLVLTLPSKHEGGDLVFGECYNTTEKMLETDKCINFVLFRINCPHRIERVTEGYRASITFKVYKTTEKSTRFTDERPVLYDIKLPKLDEPNIAVAYPNPNEIVELLKKSGIDFMFAYGDVHENITKVYSKIRKYDAGDIGEEKDNFEFIALGVPYNINKIINIGFQKSFKELRGDTGNEGYTDRFRVHYIKFILINPTDPGPKVEDQYKQDFDYSDSGED